MKNKIIVILLITITILAVSCSKKEAVQPATITTEPTASPNDPSLQGDINNYDELGQDLGTDGDLDDLSQDLDLSSL